MDQNVLFYRLEREAKYALNSHSRNLVCETYGAAKMAFELGSITKPQFYLLAWKMHIRPTAQEPFNREVSACSMMIVETAVRAILLALLSALSLLSFVIYG